MKILESKLYSDEILWYTVIAGTFNGKNILTIVAVGIHTVTSDAYDIIVSRVNTGSIPVVSTLLSQESVLY